MTAMILEGEPVAETTPDDRKHERVRTMLGAQIVFNNRMSSLTCQVRNMSEYGARIALSNTMALPQEFDLFIPARGRTYRAMLRWRSEEAVGVEFVQPGTMTGSRSSLLERIRLLESENERLRARLRDMVGLDGAEQDDDRKSA